MIHNQKQNILSCRVHMESGCFEYWRPRIFIILSISCGLQTVNQFSNSAMTPHWRSSLETKRSHGSERSREGSSGWAAGWQLPTRTLTLRRRGREAQQQQQQQDDATLHTLSHTRWTGDPLLPRQRFTSFCSPIVSDGKIQKNALMQGQECCLLLPGHSTGVSFWEGATATLFPSW